MANETRAPGEFDIIARWFTRSGQDSAVRVGIGDDAAILAPAGAIAIAVDMLVAGVHFPESLPADAIGHRVLAVNLSDLAAVGATPRWATLALSLPEADPDWLDGFAAGLFGLAERFGVSLVGGDTTRGPLTASLTLIGDAAATPLLRSGGAVGDRIFVSGTLGDSAAALEHFGARQGGSSHAAADASAPGDASAAGDAGAAGDVRAAAVRALIERFCRPEPRVALGSALTGVAHAAIDVSDGLCADLGHICEQSGAGAMLELEALPISTALAALYSRAAAENFALGGGDDYELCFTAPPEAAERIREIGARVGTPVTEIGRLTEEPGIRGRRAGETLALERAGYAHF